MKGITREWIEKAEGDFSSAMRELRARKAPNYDSACFHAQQCAEKYLKGRLQEEGIPFAKTHFLPTLLDLLLPVEPLWDAWRGELTDLSAYAATFRYPGESADRKMARQAVAICKRVRGEVRPLARPGALTRRGSCEADSLPEPQPPPGAEHLREGHEMTRCSSIIRPP